MTADSPLRPCTRTATERRCQHPAKVSRAPVIPPSGARLAPTVINVGGLSLISIRLVCHGVMKVRLNRALSVGGPRIKDTLHVWSIALASSPASGGLSEAFRCRSRPIVAEQRRSNDGAAVTPVAVSRAQYDALCVCASGLAGCNSVGRVGDGLLAIAMGHAASGSRAKTDVGNAVCPRLDVSNELTVTDTTSRLSDAEVRYAEALT